MRTAGDGEEAVRSLREEGLPDLVLLDVNMPNMDGYQLCKLLKSTSGARHVPVIMLSGKDGFFDKVRGRWAGGAPHQAVPARSPRRGSLETLPPPPGSTGLTDAPEAPGRLHTWPTKRSWWWKTARPTGTSCAAPLKGSGYVVLTARDGEEALEKASRDQPHLIVLDVVLPKKNGFQVCRQLKASHATRHIKVLILTSKCQESDRFWGLKQGADAYVTKPFSDEELLRNVAALIEPSPGEP